jgi:hypothetical protein
LSEGFDVARNGLALADPGDDEDELPPGVSDAKVKTLSFDLPLEDLDWLGRYAEYRNALQLVLAEEADAKPRRKWSRKSLGERLLSKQIEAKREKLRKVIDTLGELPDADDVDAMKKYAKRALALVKKTA